MFGLGIGDLNWDRGIGLVISIGNWGLGLEIGRDRGLGFGIGYWGG